METEYYAGIPVDVVTYETILKELPEWFKSNKQKRLTSINPQIVSLAAKHPDILTYIETSDCRFPDGIGIVVLSKWLGGEIKERVTGIELMTFFLCYAAGYQKKVFLFGSQQDIVKQAAENIKMNFKIETCAFLDGYTKLSDEEIVQQINESKADFLFVGLGFPLQEKWLAANSHNIKATIILDVGGSFDVLSGKVKRAPAFVRKYHFEWLYRSFQHPKRLIRIVQLPIFIFLVVTQKQKRLKNGEIK
ncbi:WecB/TagA/CpsF family glycosyltransferase [Carnobacterium divergens]|uniref:WecB/TagA/CpsF family glycosyltransferase n=1 Tax=Carnobacterium divergens TaxID=2748 RepID=UPI0007F548D6|nr:WecB/TagA/CpsF family glycosyltransferase [Carnobacterium divergens]SBO18534.1 Family glycosyl transferase [Carnobacterium divergens]